MKKITENLLFKVIIAIISGILLGLYLPESLGRILTTYNFLFDQFLKFLIPLIIVGLIIPSIAQLGKTAGKLLLTTVLIAYGSTLFAGLFSYTVSMSIFPSLLQNQINTELITESTKTLSPYFTIEFPPLFDVMSALVLAFCIGIGLSKLENSALEKVFIDFEKVISFIIEKMIIPLLPFFILGIFYDMTYTGKVFTILHVFIKIIGIIFVIHILLLVIQFIIAGIASKQNPFKLLIGMLPAYFTALGTQSSAATIPVTL